MKRVSYLSSVRACCALSIVGCLVRIRTIAPKKGLQKGETQQRQPADSSLAMKYCTYE